MITGVVENYDLETNLDLILKLHPKTKNIYVVNDSTMTGEALNKRLNEIIPKYNDKLNFINLQNYKQKDILSIINKPLENSIVFFLILFEDFEGNKFNYYESPKIISENSSIPVYGAWEFSLGNGIVGGMLTSGYYQGKTSAEITLRILRGEKPSSIEIIDKDTNSYMFDYVQMQRFGIELDKLPSHSYIINRPSNEKKQILVLNSYHDSMKWTQDIVKGIKTVLDDNAYELYIDYMDTKRNYTEEYIAEKQEILKYKYKDKYFDLIITSDNNAYDFMKKYHNKLFPSIPLVFCGLNDYFPEVINDTNTTGVIENIDTKKTLELALLQNPGAKNVVIINDTTLTGKANKSSINRVLPDFEDKVDFIFYEDMTMSEIQQSVSELREDTIVYLLSFNRDKANNIFSYEESAELITSKSNVPVYGAWDFSLGHGIVGGLLLNGENQGKIAAEISKEILSGEKIENIPVVNEKSTKYMFDYNKLKKYNIDMDTLPKGSVLINKSEILHFNTTSLLIIISLISFIVIILAIVNFQHRLRIKKNKTVIKELETSASIDFLTKIFNRTAGFSALNKLLSKSNIDKTIFSLCFIDLNNLKMVNDTYGHNEGDKYIKLTVKLVKNALSENHIFFRFGGDEFIILFPNTSLNEAEKLVKNIKKYFHQYKTDNEDVMEYDIGISCGLAEYNPKKPITVEELIEIADKEMYIDKKRYKAMHMQ